MRSLIRSTFRSRSDRTKPMVRKKAHQNTTTRVSKHPSTRTPPTPQAEARHDERKACHCQPALANPHPHVEEQHPLSAQHSRHPARDLLPPPLPQHPPHHAPLNRKNQILRPIQLPPLRSYHTRRAARSLLHQPQPGITKKGIV